MIHNNIVINSNINIVVQETFQRNAACASNDITRSIAVVIATHPFCCACWKLESMLYRLGIIRDNLDIELFVLKCWVTQGQKATPCLLVDSTCYLQRHESSRQMQRW